MELRRDKQYNIKGKAMKTIKEQIEELKRLNHTAYADLKRKAESRFNDYGHIADYDEVLRAGKDKNIDL